MHLRNAVPYQAALISPTPETFLNSLMVAGFFITMALTIGMVNIKMTQLTMHLV